MFQVFFFSRRGESFSYSTVTTKLRILMSNYSRTQQLTQVCFAQESLLVFMHNCNTREYATTVTIRSLANQNGGLKVGWYVAVV